MSLNWSEIHQATKDKYQMLFEHVQTMGMSERRAIFSAIRGEDVTEDTFLPLRGLRCGEFAFLQVLTEHNRREQRRS